MAERRGVWTWCVICLAVAGCADEKGREQQPPPPPAQGALTMHGCTQWDRGKLWCSASVQDAAGAWATGLPQASFTVREALAGGAPLAASFAEPEHQFDGPGFWERSVTGELIDLVFVVDHSGTMEEQMPAIRTELQRVVDALVARRADFRMGVITTDNLLPDYHVVPMHGPMAVPELRAGIDAITVETGEWWVPSALYDGVLLAVDNPADGLATRPAARKVMVVLSDSISQSIYGAIWYAGWTSTASLAAVHRLQELYDLELYFATPAHAGVEGTDPSNEQYADGDFNPYAIERGKLGTAAAELAWPFVASELSSRLGPPPVGVVDARYYFAWRSGHALEAAGAGEALRVELDARLPSGELLTGAVELPALLPQSELTLALTDAGLAPLDDATVVLTREMGDRAAPLYWDVAVSDGQAVIPAALAGAYRLEVLQTSLPGYDGVHDRVYHRAELTVAAPTSSYAALVPLADAGLELSKAHGMLDDIGRWGLSHRPYVDFVAEARAWLDALALDGLDRTEMERLRRFNAGLAGYANTLGYADVEVRSATEDFVDAVMILLELIQRITEEDGETSETLTSAITLALLDIYLATDQTTAVDQEALEGGAEEAVNELIDELKPLCVDAIESALEEWVDNPGLVTLLFDLAATLINGDLDNETLYGLLQRLVTLTLHEAFDQVAEDYIGLAIAQEINDAIADAGVEVPDSAKNLVTYVVNTALTNFDNLLDDTDPTTSFNLDIDAALTSAKNAALTKENFHYAVDELFGLIIERMDAGPARDFAMPLLHLVVKVAVDRYDFGDGAGSVVNTGMIIEVVCRLFLSHLIVDPFFNDGMNDGMNALLDEAQVFEPSGTPIDRADALRLALWDHRAQVMQPVNDAAWAAISIQETLEDAETWFEGMGTAVNVLGGVSIGMCVYYPNFCDLATDDLPTLANVLRGMRVLMNIIEFAVKIDNLEDQKDDIRATNDYVVATP